MGPPFPAGWPDSLIQASDFPFPADASFSVPQYAACELVAHVVYFALVVWLVER